MSLKDDTKLQIAWRQARVQLRRGLRLVDHLRQPAAYPPPQFARHNTDFGHVHGHSTTQIDRDDAAAHPTLEQGKRHNLALAAAFFDGLVIGPHQPLAFWPTLGRITAQRGFAYGMELRGGCIVPALGGGLCLLSNALFALGARLGWTIVERHGHSQQAVPPPVDEIWGLDATLFWPHVDLRMAPLQRVRLGCTVAGGQLHLQVNGKAAPLVRCEISAQGDQVLVIAGVRQRRNVLLRKTFSQSSGELLSHETLATNRKVLLHSWEQARSCLTCAEVHCKSRVQLGSTGGAG
ncbi:MAG: hypothetical protein EXR77_04865 [Myxococcales bacterium]|nr:hypothetical protein [Myxococcales bacterium]